ncbi:uncharacterized protein EHS24_005558 [Apiotrichum porosum]|uniref:Uncharacterized protein n=1 Tax=Apiotrichum porosum TaxID=105984 RepID=A0A427XCI2_9TREE|nr:uncharacterized protein EHS24_005558 [Apiotrichum porosum]RSH76569.1 hypothetical protein EHS24_005558 [Apiotrichum porosum]
MGCAHGLGRYGLGGANKEKGVGFWLIWDERRLTPLIPQEAGLCGLGPVADLEASPAPLSSARSCRLAASTGASLTASTARSVTPTSTRRWSAMPKPTPLPRVIQCITSWRTQLANASDQYGVSPIIRIPNAEEYMVKRALDSGAHGVTRGYGPMFSGHSFGGSDSKYPVDTDASLLVIVQRSGRQCGKNAATGSRTSVSEAWGRALENTIQLGAQRA